MISTDSRPAWSASTAFASSSNLRSAASGVANGDDMKKCNGCIATVGPISKFYCDYHAGMSAANMAAKRADDPVYRELERFAVKKRMREHRLKRGRAGPP